MADRKDDNYDDDDLEKTEDSSADFAALLDEYMADSAAEIRVGDKITGEVIAIGQDSVYIHIGGKEDGVVDKNELLDENGDLVCDKGDRMDLYVVAAGGGEIRLSKTVTAAGSADLTMP